MHTFTTFHIMRSFFFKISLIFAGSMAGTAQLPDDRIDVHNVNVRYLEHLTKEGIDSVRVAHGLKPLANDVILHKAAAHHARYLDSTHRLTHNENEFVRYRTPLLRAREYGAGPEYAIGENVAKTLVGKPVKDKKGRIHTNLTYAQTARDLVIAWVNSPPHYQNIIYPDFDVTGMAIVIDKERKEVRAVQKFGDVRFRYEFAEDAAYFAWSNWKPEPPVTSFQGISRERVARRFQWKINAPRDSLRQCGACNLAVDTAWYRDDLELQGRKMVFTSYNLPMVLALLKSPGSKLAVELVEYPAYDCGNPDYYRKPSRRNNQSLLNGNVLKPVKKKQLKKGFKGITYREAKKSSGSDVLYQVSLGNLPREMPEFTEMNLLVIRGRKLCRVMHLTRYPGKELTGLFDVPYLTKIENYQLNLGEQRRTISFTIPFELGKSNYNLNDIQPLLDSLHYDGFVVQRAQVSAYSSVEGDSTVNARLQKQRAESIMKALTLRQRGESFPYTVNLQGSWESFAEAIETEEGLAGLRGLGRSEVLKQVNIDPHRYEPFLAGQRRAQVVLEVLIKVDSSNLSGYLLGEFNRCRDSVNFTLQRIGALDARGSMYVDSMAIVQGYAYQMIVAGKADTAMLDAMELTLNPDFARVIKDHFWYTLSLSEVRKGDALWEQKFFGRLNELERKGISSYEIRFDIANYMVRSAGGKRSRVSLGEKSLALVKSLLDHDDPNRRDWAAKLLVDHHIKQAWLMRNSARKGVVGDEIREHLKAISAYHAAHNLSDSLVWRAAEFMAWCRQEDLAFELITPYARAEKTYAPLLVLFNKLSYYHIQEYPEELYYNWLMDCFEKLSPEEWCSQFVGPEGISFQVFDHEKLRRFYCERCSGFVNYTRDPVHWVIEE
jgi:uncharacterized protein YkwD